MFTVPENSEGYTIQSINDSADEVNGSTNEYITKTNLIYILIIVAIIIGVFLFFYRR